MSESSIDHWISMLPIHRIATDSSMDTDHLAGKTVLLTGAGGFIGAALARRVLAGQPRMVVLLDRSEQSLYQLERSLSVQKEVASYSLVPGEVGDGFLISALFQQYRPDLILHAAAFKHVPLMEANPFAAVKNNAIITWQLAN
ncbi:MAG TPA: polysaccharide biosynthesis protein, partial [Candidatus Sulfotelmatobacter sp.]